MANYKRCKVVKNLALEMLVFQNNTAIFVNNGSAKSADIENLINKVKEQVLNKTGINLELEIKIIGNE